MTRPCHAAENRATRPVVIAGSLESAIEPTLLGGLALGALLGARHAFEPDHLAAISTIVAGSRGRRGLGWIGTAWGLGHTASLLFVGSLLFALHAGLPHRAAAAFELLVAAMLVVLGVRGMARGVSAATTGPFARHAHGARSHAHAASARHVHVGRVSVAIRPFLVGVVHGLAGSGAMTTLALSRMPTALGGALYVLAFGAGSVLGMAALTEVAGHALGRAVRGERFRDGLVRATGALSMIVGVVWALEALRG